MRYWRYAPVEPAMAPPRRYVNSRVKMIGLNDGVEELLGDVLDLQERPPPEGERS